MPRAPCSKILFCLLLFLALAARRTFSAPLTTGTARVAPRPSKDNLLFFNSARSSDIPFGKGCVGTASLCGVALSRAEESERETLRRERPPQLWRVPEDEDFARALAEADPESRLQQYYQRLGGEDYERKREVSQVELLRLMEEYEEQGQARRLGRARAQQQVVAYAYSEKGDYVRSSRFKHLFKSFRDLTSALAKLSNAMRSRLELPPTDQRVRSPTAPHVVPTLESAPRALRRRSFSLFTMSDRDRDRDRPSIKLGRDGLSGDLKSGSESADQTSDTIPEIGAAFSFSAQARAEDDAFHQEMRQRFSRLREPEPDRAKERDAL